MSREKYIEMVKTGNFDLNIFYDYYTEFNTNDSYKFSPEEFQMWFNQYIGFLGTGNVMSTIRNHYDAKYNLASILDKNGNTIKIY